MTSYEYCTELEECLANAWNYLDRPCSGGWKKGSVLKLEDCEADLSSRECLSFTSSKEQKDVKTPRTWSLQSGTYCDFTVDAT